MTIWHLRNVPEEVVKRLKTLADREGMSVSALAVRELTRFTRRVDNRPSLADLPDLNVKASDIVNDLNQGRSER
ncbi:MAG: antitoxin [Acidimicrobiia bacterium]|nr:antitoxin [Acidimicrobiia bacterium]